MKKHRIVLLEWVDSKGVTSSWEHVDELSIQRPSQCKSVGFLLEETKDYKTIALSVGEGQVIGRMTIPSCAITKCKRLN